MKAHIQKGFTLVELLVVISIISILASVVLVSLNAAKGKGRDGMRIAQIHQVEQALAIYNSKHGQYPSNHPNSFPNNGYVFLDESVAENWAAMMQDLTSDGVIQATFSKVDRGHSEGIALISTANASVSYYYYPCSIQDPLYKAGVDYKYSFGYVASADRKSYVIRVYLENTNNQLFDSSITGSFMNNMRSTGSTACDKAFNYYCTKSVL